jgi:hypothetical protein
MSLIDKINRCIVASRRGHRSSVSIEGDEVVITRDGQRKTLRLADLTDAYLYYHAGFPARHIVVFMRFLGGDHCQLAQDDPQWFDLMAALDRSGKIAVPSSKWQLEFMAAGDKAPPLDLLTLR